jgi:hypothetical protein
LLASLLGHWPPNPNGRCHEATCRKASSKIAKKSTTQLDPKTIPTTECLKFNLIHVSLVPILFLPLTLCTPMDRMWVNYNFVSTTTLAYKQLVESIVEQVKRRYEEEKVVAFPLPPCFTSIRRRIYGIWT